MHSSLFSHHLSWFQVIKADNQKKRNEKTEEKRQEKGNWTFTIAGTCGKFRSSSLSSCILLFTCKEPCCGFDYFPSRHLTVCTALKMVCVDVDVAGNVLCFPHIHCSTQFTCLVCLCVIKVGVPNVSSLEPLRVWKLLFPLFSSRLVTYGLSLARILQFFMVLALRSHLFDIVGCYYANLDPGETV